MTRISPQKNNVPDLMAKPTQPSVIGGDVWQALIAQAVVQWRAPTEHNIDEHVPALEVGNPVRPGQARAAPTPTPFDKPLTPSLAQSDHRAPAPDDIATQAGRQAAPPDVSLPAHVRIDAIDLSAPGEHGFAYPQRLLAQAYLSQIQADVGASIPPANPETHMSGAAVLRGRTAVHEGTDTAITQDLAAISSRIQSTHTSVWGADEQSWSDSQTGESEPARPSINMDVGTAEWLRKNCTVIDEGGHLKIWVRDYGLDPHGETALVEHLKYEARQAGRRIISITLNGKTLQHGTAG